MVKDNANYAKSSALVPTKGRKVWPYEQYYTGERDQESRKRGQGINCWSGAESLDSFSGHFIRDTMHGMGEYRWRYRGPEGDFVTYEGNFFGNRMHGYGTMSYPNGKTFTGIYHSNMRWGPGIESEACLRENVGIWRGTKLIRLAWRPMAPNVAVDLISSNMGKACMEPHRLILTSRTKIIGETNSALELLKQCGAKPMTAAERWPELYAKYSNDQCSQLCHTDVFNHYYFNGQITELEEYIEPSEKGSTPSGDIEKGGSDSEEAEKYYAWNNNEMMLHMMKHCFTHESQRDETLFDLMSVISGPRKCFKLAAQHEIDCRTLLMASYLGHITNVAQLVNEFGVHPDIADLQGNSAVMYAACGDQPTVIHFLVDAGANVNSFNDSCCTPLAMALLKFACLEMDVAISGMSQALLSAPTVPPAPPVREKATEWNMFRNQQPASPVSTLNKSPSKTLKAITAKNVKSTMSIKETPGAIKKKSESPAPNVDDSESVESFSAERRLYYNINNAYISKVNDLFLIPSGAYPIPYLFEVTDMVKEIDSTEDDQKKAGDKAPKKVASKMIKDTMKPSKEMMWQNIDKDDVSIGSVEKSKNEALAHSMLTILQLLADGADPRLVNCPQPALFIATVSGSSDLIRHLVSYGADVNEIYPHSFCYSALDVAVSRPFTYQNLKLIRALLECGADAKHRLKYDDIELKEPLVLEMPGPTLLHVAIAKKSDSETQEDIRRQVIELLLDYYCSPTLQFRGKSALDMALTKRIDLLDIFIKSPRTNLNAVINSSNQTLLVKIFSVPFCNSIPSLDRLQTLTNLLLYGANPLEKCQNGEETYQNLFVFAQKMFLSMENTSTKQSGGAGKPDPKAKKVEKPKKDEKSTAKLGSDDMGDFKQAIDLVTECARLLHIRWLQAQLVNDLIDIIDRYKHRQWNMIIKEHKKKKCTGLWVTAHRCLEIWEILKTTKKKLYKDNCVLKHLLYVVHFYNTRPMSKFKPPYMNSSVKTVIESEVNCILHEHKMASITTPEIVPLKKPYVTPELYVKAEEKFNVCFECAMPFDEEKIRCILCKLVSFCSQDCIMTNIERANCHPCSNYIRHKYFPSPDSSTNTVN